MTFLPLCFKVAHALKELNPNSLPKIHKTFIVQFKTHNRLCDSKSLGGIAHYHQTKPHRICIAKKTVITGESFRAYYDGTHNGRTYSKGNEKLIGSFGIYDIMCHELAHHRTKAHGKKFALKYLKHQQQLANLIISGKFYLNLLIESQ
jgi:hypothetical protein